MRWHISALRSRYSYGSHDSRYGDNRERQTTGSVIMEAPADIEWKGYSLAERDWRWRRVRDNAAKAGLDCIFVPLCVDGRNLHLSLEQHRGTRSDCRFLTQLENAAVIMPTDGRKPIIISDQED